MDVPLVRQGENQGVGFVKFRHADDAKRALEQLNGFELAGKPMRVVSVEDTNEKPRVASNGRAPPVEQKPQARQNQGQGGVPNIATQCFMLSNMFDPSNETDEGWDMDVKDDVIDECTDHGGVVHMYVDKASSQGNVYVKCASTEVAHKSVNALHGRWFAGRHF